MLRLHSFILAGVVAWGVLVPAEVSAQVLPVRPVAPVAPVAPVRPYGNPYYMNNAWQTDPWMWWNLRHGWPYYPSYAWYWPPNYQSTMSGYYAPEQPAQQTGSAAYIRILVPDPQAAVWIDSHETSSRGASRLYETPPLPMGSTHKYKVSALWQRSGKTTTVEKDIEVTAGQTTTVDFTQAR